MLAVFILIEIAIICFTVFLVMILDRAPEGTSECAYCEKYEECPKVLVNQKRFNKVKLGLIVIFVVSFMLAIGAFSRVYVSEFLSWPPIPYDCDYPPGYFDYYIVEVESSISTCPKF